ncbi:MAG: hypothetical protein GC160_29775 [Acidobacteria bacterium]|nr:hypothetical protein [Acidobacteriota bacterium]
MPRSRSLVGLKLYRFPHNPDFDRLIDEQVLRRVRKIDALARRKGLAALKPADDALIPIGMEVDAAGRVTKNGYGVFNLAWQAADHGAEWAAQISAEVEQARKAIQEAHGVSLKYLIWAGMGGSAEDKAFYVGAGLARRRVRVYLLDSTDPRKLTAILDQIAAAEKEPLEQALKRCLIVGMAMGMTSFEPVLNLEKLEALYRKLRIPSASNFLYMTLPDSILDQFGRKNGFRRVELQPDNGNSTAGRHSGPMTRGSLYPLALNGVDLAAWMEATQLSDKEIRTAFQLAGFLQSNAREGRDKVTLHLPSNWSAGAVWTKQDFEESLGKSERIGIKIVIHEKIKPINFYSPKSKRQDRCFLFVEAEGARNPDPQKITALRRAGYPTAVLRIDGEYAVARYMQLIHYVVFALGYLRDMNFVTQPGVELYKDYARAIYDEGLSRGGVEKSTPWRDAMRSKNRLKWRGGLAVSFDALLETGLIEPAELELENGNPPAVLAAALERLRKERKVSYGELTFFGDTRYDPAGRKALRVLESSADAVFRSKSKMPADVYEGPAMNHSYHEMIIGFGGGFSLVVLSEKQAAFPKVGYKADYHRAQWLATQRALADRGRAVCGVTIPDLTDAGIECLRELFSDVARRLSRPRD